MAKVKLFAAFTHIVGLAIFLSLPILFIATQEKGHSIAAVLFTADTVLFIGTYIFIFYFHTYFQIPQLYRKKKWILYIISLLLLLGAVLALQPFDRLMHKSAPATAIPMPPSIGPTRAMVGIPPAPPPFRPMNNADRRTPGLDIISIYLFAMTLAFSMSVEFRKKVLDAEQSVRQAHADKANAELSSLKAQIHPHFLFNTLNNIYSLAAVHSEKTTESILKLSHIMRYVTDEVGDNYVPLEQEITFLTDYIDLQRLRLGKTMKVNVTMPEYTYNKSIAPLVLITFVENAFKYGISNHTTATITIALMVAEQRIRFFCHNRVFDKPVEVPTRSGIGIHNTQTRLAQLYPGKHSLRIIHEKDDFSVELIIEV
jgi:two-component system LytT family sensor kinase